MKAAELRDVTQDELAQQLEESRKELLNLRIQKSTGQVEQPLMIRQLRRDIARIQTVMRESENRKEGTE